MTAILVNPSLYNFTQDILERLVSSLSSDKELGFQKFRQTGYFVAHHRDTHTDPCGPKPSPSNARDHRPPLSPRLRAFSRLPYLMSVQWTRTHAYPTAEGRVSAAASGAFTRWAKALSSGQLDAALDSSTERAPYSPLRWMLERGLREDRYPAHPGERQGCSRPHAIPARTCFVRTLEYELEVARIRQFEFEAGNGDPGRPPYIAGYGNLGFSDSISPTARVSSTLRTHAPCLGNPDVRV
ncbi:hypothetical protein C8F04DRAFT_1178575 [Mycena alexandri]|uniref:Uncharacterized protein n=1 Tax=Mycena alexandri TaxID=1745969 RepID=A0AAD6X919_9AGAR|nr:hypothetical protein C8F04DRAFT_1178575 [Mycena alexandri]